MVVGFGVARSCRLRLQPLTLIAIFFATGFSAMAPANAANFNNVPVPTTGATEEDVFLPTWLVGTLQQQSEHLRRGTEVYKCPVFIVTFKDTLGRMTSATETAVQSVQNTSSGVIVTGVGNAYVSRYPSGSVVQRVQGYTLIFVAPGETRPPIVAGSQAAFIVP